MTKVDIHAHTFNADDLPVRGFVNHVVLSHGFLQRVVGKALDRAIDGWAQSKAQGFDELQMLDRMLEEGDEGGGLEVGGPAVTSEVAVEADLLLAELESEDPVLVAAASAEAQVTHPEATDGGGVHDENLLDGPAALKRWVAFALLFGKSRWDLTVALMRLYSSIDVFVTLLVDFQRLDDVAKTSVEEQLQMQERISRLSLLGHTPGVVLPFVGFDPRRAGGLGLVKRAVAEYGAVGVKMYPPMGFRPLKNVDALPFGMTRDDAIGADHQLAELYGWCSANDVPITAHCNPSNYANDGYKRYSEPANWALALAEFPDLRLNLGHFGWGSSGNDDWPRQIAELMATYPHLYADIGNHELGDIERTLDRLEILFGQSDTKTAAKRFMFGSDWFMVASHRAFETFADVVETKFRDRFPEHGDGFMGAIAMEFLGFSEADNKNRARLVERVHEHGAQRPAWLTV